MYSQCATMAMTSLTRVGHSTDAYGFAQGRDPGSGPPPDGWPRRCGCRWPRATAPAIGRHGASPASSHRPRGLLTPRGPLLRREEGPGLAGDSPTCGLAPRSVGARHTQPRITSAWPINPSVSWVVSCLPRCACTASR